MTNISGSKLMHYPERIARDRRPITCDVFLNNYCNNKCPYCVYRRWEMDAGAYAMTAGEFEAYASRLIELGVLGIILTGGGEPMITPDFEHITSWMEKRGIHYGINSNFNVLKYCKPDYLKVSLDGWDEDSYEACRGVRAYNQVCQNIVKYDGWRQKHSPTTSLGVQKVIVNSDEIMPFYRANKGLPFDYMALRPMESTGGKFYADESARKDAERAIRIIRELGEWDSRVVLNFKWEMLQTRCEECSAHWSQLAMNEHGNIMFCCHKPFQVIGNVMDSDIMEKHRAAHTDMNLCDIPCRLTAPNLYMAEIEAGTKDPYFI